MKIKIKNTLTNELLNSCNFTPVNLSMWNLFEQYVNNLIQNLFINKNKLLMAECISIKISRFNDIFSRENELFPYLNDLHIGQEKSIWLMYITWLCKGKMSSFKQQPKFVLD